MSQALYDAARNDLVAKNVARLQGAPTVEDGEVEIVPKERFGELADKLRGRAMYARAIIALLTGLRRGEILALRWSNVGLEAKMIRVRKALQETTGQGTEDPRRPA